MELFPRKPRTILDELTDLENMMPTYKEELLKVSKFIRRNVWEQVDDGFLLKLLGILNTLYSCSADVIGQDFEVISEYVSQFSKYICGYTPVDISKSSQALLEELWQEQIQKIILKQWTQLDPARRSEFDENEIFRKNLLEIMDDFWDTLTPEAMLAFWHPLKSYPKLIRGRKETRTQAIELAAPSLETIEKYHILNRWTPPGKRYLYLVDANNPSQNPEKVCLEEMRVADPNQDVTIAQFTVQPDALEDRILDLDYEDTSVENIFQQSHTRQSSVTDKIIQELLSGSSVTERRIKKKLQQHQQERRCVAQIFCGQHLLKQICTAIFTPLDDDSDSDDELKERCYKSFHLFAEWCEGKDIAGIRYPSTRMKLIHERGTNIVLFNADSAVADESTFRIIRNT